MSQIEEIKDRIDIVDIISAYVPLKKAGRHYKGLCPFHAEKTPSFVVYPETGTWHCFGACGTGGDVFNFLMKKENLDFGEALRRLADKAGVVLEERRPARPEEESLFDLMREINAAAASYYHHLLLHSPRAGEAREYVARRGLSGETSGAFEIGYAPDEWDALWRYLNGKGYATKDIEAAGLIIQREGGGYYDRFRNRLLIPIRDRRGRTSGFGARALGDAIPKYLNSPQTPIFDKGAVLYGLDRAARDIRARGEAVIVEGYMDVLTAHQHGLHNVVACMGTALTEPQMKQLTRLARRLVLALDPDTAGDAATLRGLHVIRNAAERVPFPRFGARGTLVQERKLLVDLRVARLPQGLDPDEVIKGDVEAWQRLIAGARPLAEYFMTQVLGALDLNDPSHKARAVQEMKPVLQEMSDEIERRHYIQLLARRIRIDEEAVEREILGGMAVSRRRSVSAPSARYRRRREPASLVLVDQHTPREATPRALGKEEQCLVYLTLFPKLIQALSVLFADAGIPRLESEDFQRPENRTIFSSIMQDVEGGAFSDLERMIQTLSPPLSDYLEILVDAARHGPTLSEDEVADDLARCALRLKSLSLRRSVEQLYYLLEEPAMDMDREQAREFALLIHRYSVVLQQIHKTLHQRSMVGKRDLLEADVSVTTEVITE